MDELTDHIAAADAAIESCLDQLEAHVAQLRGAWTGEASDAYSSAQAAWSASLAEMRRILADAHRTTSAITERHRATEQGVLAMWGAE
jgi:WXG100 family type VII secretion target